MSDTPNYDNTLEGIVNNLLELDGRGELPPWEDSVELRIAKRAYAQGAGDLAAAQAALAEAERRGERLKVHAGAFARCRIVANGYTDWSKEALDEAFAAYLSEFKEE